MQAEVRYQEALAAILEKNKKVEKEMMGYWINSILMDVFEDLRNSYPITTKDNRELFDDTKARAEAIVYG